MSLALAHFVRAMERRFPGIADEWLESLENDAAHAEVIRLREARELKSLTAARQKALTWARYARAWVLVSLGHEHGHAGAKEPKDRKERRR